MCLWKQTLSSHCLITIIIALCFDMSHFGDFMDGVPVKISEKYKPPPRIQLPYSVIEGPVRSQYVVDSSQYNSTFEKNVIEKLKELRSIKETKKNERRHRLQLLEEAKQKKLDAIAAAEEEERLKQLSLSEVSYPSTDEISALSPDERADKTCDTNVNNTPENTEIVTPRNTHAGNVNESQLNILQPIQVKSNYQENSLLDDPDPLKDIKMNMKVNKVQYNHNVDTLTFQDFENDTSSPFDNVELKTINDMEQLAQVLQIHKDVATSFHLPQGYVQEQTYIAPNCASQVQLETLSYLPNTYVEQPIQGGNIMYTAPQLYPNGYYVSDGENMNMYAQNYQYYVPSNPYPTVDQFYGHQMPSTSMDIPNDAQYIPQPYYFHYPQVQEVAMPYTSDNTASIQTETSTHNTPKSRSRSVPDIVKELNEELSKLRATERSYNASPAPKALPSISKPPQPSGSGKKEERRRRKSEHLPNPFDKLSTRLQEMCQKIHNMGFPIDRVARVCTLVGDNDKKVIEGLLILGELMDLGFPEGKVSAALAKHEFNKDKALDELVS